MIMVSIGTFDWCSFKYLRRAPRTDAIVMLVTVIIVVATSDLSKGVNAGVILSAIFFVAKISKIKVKETVEASRTDRKSTRLNSSHVAISYAVFCLKKKIREYLLMTVWLLVEN